MSIFQAIDRKPKGYVLISWSFFVKSRMKKCEKDMNKWVNKIATIFAIIYSQYNVCYFCSMISNFLG